ncbi:M55 family metallopeptidase [Kribbella albertanoniae]|uniref:Aminopeptidase n=1 Tax=Kribbella albertanoniae TaxID=1266829 RepID=A0A4R4PI92_9ACTN|nr:M55 family metallopeptidase [Kribbella albertanoniae]TDC21584.1 aminopeptidase [Kribbella albertanoniae]
MRVFISVDMEGIAGIATPDQAYRGGHNYPMAQRLITAETNAAIAGAFDAGATEVLVNDAHGTMDNLLPDLLDERAEVLQGWPKAQCMIQGLTSEHDIALFVGYHAPAGSPGVFSHTLSSLAFTRFLVNGEIASETDLGVLQAAALGVPVGLVTGDDEICRLTREKHRGVEAVQVKRAVGQFAAASVHPTKAQALVRAGAAAAVRRADQLPVPQLPEALTLTVDLKMPAHAEIGALIPGMRQIDRLRLEFDAASPDQLLGVCALLWETAPGHV